MHASIGTPGALTLVRAETTREHHGTPTRRLQQKIEAPTLGADRTGYELWVARRAFELLDAAYPGHLWFVDCDLAKGGVLISIPVLMGGNWVYFVGMKDLAPKRVVMAGGELLERYNLDRGKIRVDQFVEARDKHSILANRASKVPA